MGTTITASSKGMTKSKAEDAESSRQSVDLLIYGTKHYSPENDVLLRLETITGPEVRILNLCLWIWLTLALGALIWLFVAKISDPASAVKSFVFVNVNIAIGSACFLAVSAALLAHCARVAYNWRKDWVSRRAKACALITVELVAQWINLAFFLLPNAYLHKADCIFFSSSVVTWSAFIRWTMWNLLLMLAVIRAHNSNIGTAAMAKRMGREGLKVPEDMLMMVADMPFWVVHWWKILLWLIQEGCILATTLYVIKATQGKAPIAIVCEEARQQRYYCALSWRGVAIASVMTANTIIYFCLYCFFLFRAMHQLRANSNVEFKLANSIVRIQLRLRFPAFTVFILSIVVLWYVKPFSCNSSFNTWLGLLPGQMSASILVICSSFTATPKLRQQKGRPPLLQVWLQEFAWSEKQKPIVLLQRNGSMAPEDQKTIQEEPLFCFEHCIACLYWSFLIYDYKEVPGSWNTIEEGCSLFRPALDKYELIWEKSMDTKCLLAWNRQHIVLAFRGTASLSNVKADLQAWRTHHRPLRGSFWRRPKVHSGFDKAWRTNGLDERILDRIKELLTSGAVDRDCCHLTITGHSLGSALANLAAYDICAISTEYGFQGRVTCTTFGGPRTGNHQFAREFNAMVPDCWNVINDNDVVARGMKFFVYKRGGHRVIINKMGDLIVRPNPMEASLRLLPCAGSVQQHLLTSYLQSFMAIMVAQFKPTKGPKTDMLAVLDLVRNNSFLQKLLRDEVGVTIQDLEAATSKGGSKDLIIRFKKALNRKQSDSTSTARGYLADSEEAPHMDALTWSCCAPLGAWSSSGRDSLDKKGIPLTDVKLCDGSAAPLAIQIEDQVDQEVL